MVLLAFLPAGSTLSAQPSNSTVSATTSELMPLDILDLRSFYDRPLGGIVRRVLTRRVRARWRNVQGLQLMGLGFAAPYVGQFRDEAGRLGR